MAEIEKIFMLQKSKKELYDTLKSVHGPNFIIPDSVEEEKKYSKISTEQRNNYIAGLAEYNKNISSNPKSVEQLAKELELDEILKKREEEKKSLIFIHKDCFVEVEKNKLWRIKLFLDFLTDVNYEENNEASKEASKVSDKSICRSFLQGNCKLGKNCKFVHKKPEVASKNNMKKDLFIDLEIIFPENNRYPAEAPFFNIKKNNDVKLPSLDCLKISQVLHEKAKRLLEEQTLSIFAIIKFLENKDCMLKLLKSINQYTDVGDLDLNDFKETHETVCDNHEITSDNKKKVSFEDSMKKNKEIKLKLSRSENVKNRNIMKHRENLPTWGSMKEILKTIDENQVTIISGETGCGKSTQVPQFILDEWINNSTAESKKYFEIISTQPRRISATSLAERVAVERNEKLGDIVGYKIKLKSEVSADTKLMFCTTGILLHKLIHDPLLEGISHIIVDEVHERTADSDFLLMILIKLLVKRIDLKLILMSATLNTQKFSSYFNNAPIIHITGRTYPVKELYLEDILDILDFDLVRNTEYITKKGQQIRLSNIGEQLLSSKSQSMSIMPADKKIKDEDLTLPQLCKRFSKNSMLTWKNLYLMDYDIINYSLIERIIEWIIFGNHEYPKTGTILVFLPGLTEIHDLLNCIQNNPELSSAVVIPLHSSFSVEEQNLIFEKTRPGDRKIVVSTNIAETSITIEDCVFVIDAGVMKEKRFLPDLNIETLETCWISQTNAIQRKGRAGRVMPGVCIHLFSSYRYHHQFQIQQEPEILRIPLESVILRIHVLNRGHNFDLHDILDSLLDCPQRNNISSTIKRLQDVAALDQDCKLTLLGLNLARLPVDVRIGKLILFGTIFSCLDSALTIAAFLSHKSPFLNSTKIKEKVKAKKEEYGIKTSDHLTILKVYKKWLSLSAISHQQAQDFTKSYYLSINTLETIRDIKYHFLESLVYNGFISVNLGKCSWEIDNVAKVTGSDLNVNNENTDLLRGLLSAALYPNIAKVSGIYTRNVKNFVTIKDTQQVFIHPSSITFPQGRAPPTSYLVYQEKLKTKKLYMSEISFVSTISLIMLASSSINIKSIGGGTYFISSNDGCINLYVESYREAKILKLLKEELNKLLQNKMANPSLSFKDNSHAQKIMTSVINLISSHTNFIDDMNIILNY